MLRSETVLALIMPKAAGKRLSTELSMSALERALEKVQFSSYRSISRPRSIQHEPSF